MAGVLRAEGASPDLGEALREAAADLAAQLGGSVLVFARSRSAASPPALRAAAGFASADQARGLAEAVEESVAAVVKGGSACDSVTPEDESLRLVPVSWSGEVLGVVAAATRGPLDGAGRSALERAAGGLALRLDHADLLERLGEAEQQLALPETGDDEDKSDELLKLSEALFNQDIELLRKNERLGKVEKLKNDFIEKMSRELRTPLNSIIEAIISVLAGENENLSEGAKQSLRRALDDGSSFLRTLQNILDLWRIKQGELPVEIQEVNFREVVEEAIFSVQDALGDKPIRIEKEIAEPLAKIRTDLAKVNQILFLLLENAVKFTLEGTITIGVEVSAGQLVCSLQDTGIGICPDDRQFIFDEFFQVDEFASSGYRGAGLGLALVRDLLVLLEGEIDVASEVGHGSTFSFRVPVEPVA